MNKYIASNVNVQNALSAYFAKEEISKHEKTLFTLTEMRFYNSTKVIRENYSGEVVAYKLLDGENMLNLYAIVDKVRGIVYNVRTYILFAEAFRDKPISTIDFIKGINKSYEFIKSLIIAENLINYKVYFYTPFRPFYNQEAEIVLDIVEMG